LYNYYLRTKITLTKERLEMKEVKKTRDPQTQEEWLIYRKSVRFVMAKLNKERDDLLAINKYLQDRIAQLERK